MPGAGSSETKNLTNSQGPLVPELCSGGHNQTLNLEDQGKQRNLTVAELKSEPEVAGWRKRRNLGCRLTEHHLLVL